MPPAAKHDIGTVFFDVRLKHELLDTLLKFIAYEKINTKDQHRLVLFNVAGATQFSCVEFPEHVTKLNLKEIQQSVQNAEITEDALQMSRIFKLGLRYLKQLDGAGVVTKQIIVFSDLANFIPIEEEINGDLLNKINRDNIYVYMIGPDVTFLEPVKGSEYFCDEESYKNKIVLNNPTDELEKIRDFMFKIRGIMADKEAGLHLLITCRQTAGSQPCQVPLTVGSKISIGVHTSKVYRTDLKIHVKKDKIQGEVEEQLTLENDMSVKVDIEDTVRGLLVHDKFIEIRNEQDVFQTDTEPTFDIICLAPSDSVPEPYHIGEDSFIVLCSDTSPDKRQFFNNIVDLLAETKKVAIVSRVYIRKTQPKYFVLIPVNDFYPKRFMMTELSSGDEIKDMPRFYFPDKPKAEVDPDIRDFVKSMDVTNRDGIKKIKLQPTMMMTWRDHKVLDLIVEEESAIEVV